MSKNTVIYGLTGFPLGHSFSKAFFTDKFREEGLDAEYLNFPLETCSREAVAALIETHPRLRGLNVTSPHKRAAFALADTRTPEAEAVGAANTLRFSRRPEGDGLFIEAHNTDVEGFREAVRGHIPPGVRAALVCGTGGAADAVAVALRSLGITSLFVSRNPAARPGAIAYREVDAALLASHPLVVNATPLGAFPAVDTCVSLPFEFMSDRNLCVDLVYNPSETLFMKRARRAGASALNGAEMLRLQAIASYDFWNNFINSQK